MDQPAPTATAVESLLRPYAALAVDALYAEQERLKGEAAAIKVKRDALAAELSSRFTAQIDSTQSIIAKSTVHLDVAPGIVADRVTKNEVDWDSEKLLVIASGMTWERVRKLFKIELSMSAAIYKGVAAIDEDLKAKLDDARTLKPVHGSVTLSKKDVK